MMASSHLLVFTPGELNLVMESTMKEDFEDKLSSGSVVCRQTRFSRN